MYEEFLKQIEDFMFIEDKPEKEAMRLGVW